MNDHWPPENDLDKADDHDDWVLHMYVIVLALSLLVTWAVL